MSGNMIITDMTEEDLAQMRAEHEELNPDRPVRPDVIESLEHYVQHGLRPGGFLLAVLKNDLFDAFARADSYNRATMFQIVQYIYNELPAGSWGSPERVREWIKSKREAESE